MLVMFKYNFSQKSMMDLRESYNHLKEDNAKLTDSYNDLVRKFNLLQDDFTFAEEDRAMLEEVTADDLADLTEEHIKCPEVNVIKIKSAHKVINA